MYSPPHYREGRDNLIVEVVRRFSFATLITAGTDGPFVSHLPLLLDETGRSLLGHCARANPQWRHFAEGQTVTAIFQGPHAYISPAWYRPQSDNVPTWNYVAVHARGKASLINAPEDVYASMQTLVRHFEAKYETGWSLPEAANADLEALCRAIVVFRIDIQETQAKFKLSQKEEPPNRENVIRQLPLSQGSDGAGVAEYMKKVLGSN